MAGVLRRVTQRREAQTPPASTQHPRRIDFPIPRQSPDDQRERFDGTIRAVRSDTTGIPGYRFKRALKDTKNVREWREARFATTIGDTR